MADAPGRYGNHLGRSCVADSGGGGMRHFSAGLFPALRQVGATRLKSAKRFMLSDVSCAPCWLRPVGCSRALVHQLYSWRRTKAHSRKKSPVQSIRAGGLCEVVDDPVYA